MKITEINEFERDVLRSALTRAQLYNQEYPSKHSIQNCTLDTIEKLLTYIKSIDATPITQEQRTEMYAVMGVTEEEFLQELYDMFPQIPRQDRPQPA